MINRFYAVQHGGSLERSYGSKRKRKAVKMAREMCLDRNYEGEEIRIAVIDTAAGVCKAQFIVRDGDIF